MLRRARTRSIQSSSPLWTRPRKTRIRPRSWFGPWPSDAVPPYCERLKYSTKEVSTRSDAVSNSGDTIPIVLMVSIDLRQSVAVQGKLSWPRPPRQGSREDDSQGAVLPSAHLAEAAPALRRDHRRSRVCHVPLGYPASGSRDAIG